MKHVAQTLSQLLGSCLDTLQYLNDILQWEAQNWTQDLRCPSSAGSLYMPHDGIQDDRHEVLQT